MLYRQKLELDIEEIRPDLNIVRNASHELRSSQKFKQVLQVRPLFPTLPACANILLLRVSSPLEMLSTARVSEEELTGSN
jgi:hypothetical protein